MPAPMNSEDNCIGWPMWGRTPDSCHWVPPECSPKSSQYELEWTYDLKDYLLLRKILLVGNRVIAYGYSGKLYSFLANPPDKNGKLLWTYDLKSPMKTPCFDSGRLYVSLESGSVECIDFAKKSLIWSKKLTGFVDSHPIVYRNRLYLNTSDSANVLNSKKCFFTCIDSNTSRTIWTYDRIGRMFGAPVFSGNYMCIGADSGRLYCFDITKVSAPENIAWTVELGDKVYTPAIRNGKVYAIAQVKDNNFDLVCLNLKTGEILWKYSTQKRGEYYDYVTVNDKYWVCDTLNGFICLDVETGKVVWSSNELGFSATMTDDYVFTVNNTEVVCADLKTGQKLWSYPVKSPTLPTTIDRDRIYLMGDNTIYCFKLINPTYPELTDLGDAGEPGSGIVKPVKITVNPQVVYMEPGQKQQFQAKVFDINGNILDTDNIVWETDCDLGEIDTKGMFTAKKEGICKLSCMTGELTAQAEINIVKFLKAKPSPVEFRNVAVGSKQKQSVRLTCSNIKPLAVRLKSNDSRITISNDSLFMNTGTFSDIDVTLSAETLNPGDVFSTSITADYDIGSLEIPVDVSVSADRFDCFSVEPARLDFGFVDRGTSKQMKFVINTTRKTHLRLKPSNSWLQLSESEFDTGIGSKEVFVTIASSSLPKGENFTGAIEITDDKGYCKYMSVPVFIETQSGIVLELTIDSDLALLNKMPVKMDAPARIINGRTMVPIRFISESFGCKVEWDAKEGKVTIIRNDITIRLWKGKNFAKVNEDEKTLDSPPIIIKGRTYVPLRFISEPFGAKVNWDKVLKKITIIWDPL